MKYTVYTDGATNVKEGKAASAFLIRTKTKFIAMNAYVLNTKNNTHAEMFAIGAAAEYLRENVDIASDDIVEVITDSQRARDLINNLWKNPDNQGYSDVKIRLTMKNLKALAKVCVLKIKKMEAHTEGWHGNKVADRLAKFSLNRSLGL